MGPAGDGLEPHQAAWAIGGEDAVARDREPRALGALGNAAHHVLRPALHEPLANLPLGASVGSRARDRDVGLPGHAVVEGLGQSRRALAGPGEGQRAADGPVEAMDDAEEDRARLAELLTDPGLRQVDHGGVPAVVGDRRDAGGLDHAEDVVRDVEDVETGHQASPTGSSGGRTMPRPQRAQKPAGRRRSPPPSRSASSRATTSPPSSPPPARERSRSKVSGDAPTA